jgi:dethiobiotin synthetase
MSARAIVVTGTDTGVGKTVFCAALAAALDAYYWKPIQAGTADGGDRERVAALSGLSPERLLPEAYRLATPCSPHRAAQIEGIVIDPARLGAPRQRPLVIEGSGGALVPLADGLLLADQIAAWRFPTVIVARTQLGTINHSLLTIEALRSRGIDLLGVVFIGDQVEESEAAIARIGGARRLGRLPWLDPFDAPSLKRAFRAAFRTEDFR